MSAGIGGDSGDVSREGEPDPALVLPLRWKNESIEGWYCRLRMFSAMGADIAIVLGVLADNSLSAVVI